MNEQTENLSSLLDDYRSTDTDESTLNDALGDINQRYTLRRYQMIGDIMSNDLPKRIKPDFAAEVMAHIAVEPALISVPAAAEKAPAKRNGLWSSLFKPMAGVAVAATVAFIAVSSVQLQTRSAQSDDQLAQSKTSATDARVEQLASIPVINEPVKVSVKGWQATSPHGTSWKIRRGTPAFQKKLNTYLINHNEFSKSMQGIIPQARVVGFDVQK